MPMDSPQACLTAFTAALIRRDMSAALALLTEDVVLFYSNGTVIVGKDQFEKTMKSNWLLVEEYRYSALDTIWLTESDVAAAVIYHFEWSGLARGQAVSGGGRGTRVFRRETSGWLIAHEHLSTGQWNAPTEG